MQLTLYQLNHNRTIIITNPISSPGYFVNSTDEGPGPKRLEKNSNQNTALFFIIFLFSCWTFLTTFFCRLQVENSGSGFHCPVPFSTNWRVAFMRLLFKTLLWMLLLLLLIIIIIIDINIIIAFLIILKWVAFSKLYGLVLGCITHTIYWQSNYWWTKGRHLRINKRQQKVARNWSERFLSV